MEASAERASSPTNINDLFDYDVGLDEIFQGNNDASNNDAPKATGDPSSLGLGLDEEVKITKKRQPIAKLDEARLLSQPGIPKLRRTAKDKLRLKGKGHEFSDAARLLNFYQLWLDDLYPRAKFTDGLAMIEKLGHTKRIQTMRKEWIDDEKRKVFENYTDTRDLPTRLSSDQNGGATKEMPNSTTIQAAADGSGSPDDLFMPDPEGTIRQSVSHPAPDDDDLEDLLREQYENMPGEQQAAKQMPNDGLDDDDLDDLLREQDEDMLKGPQPAKQVPKSGHDDFDAEYEAMNEMGL
ncbi:Chromosome segregation in meiosis protein 3 [Penicillium frequentans]|uniref:Chromosome segregation in meiosis protein n=1 Tax=Penicillium frequentans TaxID=3151616 RepID=A0AAD6CNJ3_9EURO|nr:Chromosome segregation in meiosis protein 3 [Penicillium glabrum]